MAKPKVLGIVLAGGEGKRLWPLTADRAKPAVPFGGNFRLIDFVLSNLVNAGYLRICVLTQYKSHSLDRHITTTWRMSQLIGNYVTPVPAQQRLGPRWYTGSADAILQSLNLVYDEKPDYLVVFGADHVYRMDPAQMVQDHIDTGAEATVAGIRVPRREATAFGVIQTADDGVKIAGFLEKPADPPSVPGRPGRRLRVDGQLRLLHRGDDRGAEDRRRRRDVRARHGRQHHSVLREPGDGARLRLRPQRGAGRDRPRPRLLAGRRHPGRVQRRAHGPGVDRADLQPLQPRVADPELPGHTAAGQVRRGRHGPRLDDRHRHDHLRRHASTGR